MNPNAAADFVARFEAFWREPRPDRLGTVLTEDVRLFQPHRPRIEGIADARSEFGRLLAAIPDLRADVLDWSGNATSVFIAIHFKGSWGGRALEWRGVDHLRLRGERAYERRAYFDLLELAGKLVRRPQGFATVLALLSRTICERAGRHDAGGRRDQIAARPLPMRE